MYDCMRSDMFQRLTKANASKRANCIREIKVTN